MPRAYNRIASSLGKSILLAIDRREINLIASIPASNYTPVTEEDTLPSRFTPDDDLGIFEVEDEVEEQEEEADFSERITWDTVFNFRRRTR